MSRVRIPLATPAASRHAPVRSGVSSRRRETLPVRAPRSGHDRAPLRPAACVTLREHRSDGPQAVPGLWPRAGPMVVTSDSRRRPAPPGLDGPGLGEARSPVRQPAQGEEMNDLRGLAGASTRRRLKGPRTSKAPDAVRPPRRQGCEGSRIHQVSAANPAPPRPGRRSRPWHRLLGEKRDRPCSGVWVLEQSRGIGRTPGSPDGGRRSDRS